MTSEEAIEELEKLKRYVEPRFYRDGYLIALEMAIEALKGGDAKMTGTPTYMQQSPSDGADLISRADAMGAVQDHFNADGFKGYDDGQKMMDRIKELPSADRPSLEWKLASEELPQSVGSYIVTCKDEYGSVYVDYDFWTVLDEFKYNCSKVTAWIPFPKPYCPSGEWVIRENGNKECSLCGHERQDGWDYFCGYCGARMKGEK